MRRKTRLQFPRGKWLRGAWLTKHRGLGILPMAIMVFFSVCFTCGSEEMLLTELTEQQKRQLFLKSRDDARSSGSVRSSRLTPKTTPTPSPHQAPKPVPTAKSTPVSAGATSRVPKDSAAKEASGSKPLPAQKSGSISKPTPSVIQKATLPVTDSVTSENATPLASETPKVDAVPASSKIEKPSHSSPKPKASGSPVKVVIEKSGKQEDEGFQPAPKRGLWSKRWKYLTPGVRRQIDAVKVRKGRWKYIIIHNSGTRQGNAKIFDNYHRRVRKMQGGLAYHFVIGNGTSSGNGEIEIGSRWVRQINGGHVASDYLNNIAIGICLVGDFNNQSPKQSQMEALRELTAYLRMRTGKFDGKLLIVRGHKEINPKPTDCPGRKFPLSWLRNNFK